MQSTRVQKLLLQKQLGDRLAWTIRRNKARFVLIVSPKVGDGKSTFFCMIRPYLECRYPDDYCFLEHRDLRTLNPYQIPEEMVVLIDGPAIMEGVESLAMPPTWQEVIKDAIIVIMGRSTSHDDLQDSVSRLEAMEIRCIGAIYNEMHDPSWQVRKQTMTTKVEKVLPWGKKQPTLEEAIPIFIPPTQRNMTTTRKPRVVEEPVRVQEDLEVWIEEDEDHPAELAHLDINVDLPEAEEECDGPNCGFEPVPVSASPSSLGPLSADNGVANALTKWASSGFSSDQAPEVVSCQFSQRKVSGKNQRMFRIRRVYPEQAVNAKKKRRG